MYILKIPPINPTSFYVQPPVSKVTIDSDETMESTVEQVPIAKTKRVYELPKDALLWTDNVRLHHPEKYAEWLAQSKEKNLKGYPDVSILPHGFSIKDYYAEQHSSEEK